ncbi:hypothetical protein PHSY_006362 [Pseudozyma hubeiensis SY62]|uniref:Uncharacterized protein n=1 Tax=Pseudozyma hubeiensis (strain SY62) TaxID=1305764 RepID=R9PC11_PSEHS|nr:hypothetical protein PHSY_006362 [Pseudozyma hubeiensis SY62]GAC98767.1 hypothetical protein PHSY_006362 [Pseudozyma hubeiensis SY62]
MQIFCLLFLATFAGYSLQTQWDQLLSLSEEEAKAFLGGTFSPASQGESTSKAAQWHDDDGRMVPRGQMHRQLLPEDVLGQSSLASLLGPSVHEHEHPDNGRDPSDVASLATTRRILTTASSSVQSNQDVTSSTPSAAEASLTEPPNAPDPSKSSAQGRDVPPLSLIGSEHLHAPRVLTVRQRNDVLRDAANHLQLSKGRRVPILFHPFMEEALTDRFLDEFAKSKNFLREYKPGFLVQTRSLTSKLWQGQGGIVLQRELMHQLFVYRYLRMPATSRPRTVFQFVGMLEINRPSHEAVRPLKAFSTTRVLVQAIGPDSFVDHSSLAIKTTRS